MQRFSGHTCVNAVPNHLPSKVPNYVSYTQKALKRSIPMLLVRWVLRELNIVPCGEEHYCIGSTLVESGCDESLGAVDPSRINRMRSTLVQSGCNESTVD